MDPTQPAAARWGGERADSELSEPSPGPNRNDSDSDRQTIHILQTYFGGSSFCPNGFSGRLPGARSGVLGIQNHEQVRRTCGRWTPWMSSRKGESAPRCQSLPLEQRQALSFSFDFFWFGAGQTAGISSAFFLVPIRSHAPRAPGLARQWPEVSDFVAFFCALRESKHTRTCENHTQNARDSRMAVRFLTHATCKKSVTHMIYLGSLPRPLACQAAARRALSPPPPPPPPSAPLFRVHPPPGSRAVPT